MKGKICILSSVHQALDVRIFYKEATTLTRSGYHVTIIAQHDKDETVEGIRIIALPRPTNRLQRMIGLTIKVLFLAIKQRADIYHFHDPELLPVGLLLRLFSKGKIVYDVHEEYYDTIRLEREWIPFILRRPIAEVFRIFERLASRFFDHIIVATESISKIFHNSKPTVIRNYSSFALANSPETSRPLNKDTYILIYAGNLDKFRGICQIVNSLDHIGTKHKVRLLLLGSFSDPKYEGTVRVLKGFDKVDLLGYVPHREVYKFLAKADIGLYCPLPIARAKVSLPLKIFEYMATGLPIVTANFPLWQEIVESDNCGITVDPLDPKEIANAVEYLLDNPEIRLKMSENGKRAALKKYNWEKEAKKLLALYEGLPESKTE